MSEPMCFAELNELHVELLPARTVLSLWPVGTGGNGDPGTAGANGQGGSKFSFFGIFGYGGSDSTYTFGGSTTSSRG